MIAIDLSKQQARDAAIQQIILLFNNFTNLDRNGNSTMFFIIEEAKETVLDFSQGTVKVLRMYSTILFCSNIISK